MTNSKKKAFSASFKFKLHKTNSIDQRIIRGARKAPHSECLLTTNASRHEFCAKVDNEFIHQKKVLRHSIRFVEPSDLM